MKYEHLLMSVDGPITTITLNRPEKRNALAMAVMLELTQALQAVARSEARGLILAANGPVFSAGHNFGDRAGATLEQARELFAVCTAMMDAIQAMPQVVIARVHGIATAAGCQLVAQCDLAVAAEEARFAVSGINVGLFCSTPAVALSRNLGRKQAMEMLLTGDFIDAREAQRRGLVNRVVAATELDAELAKLCASIVAKSPLAVATGKQMFYRQLEMGLTGAYQYAAEVMACNMMAEDVGEGLDAFMGKRPAQWKGC